MTSFILQTATQRGQIFPRTFSFTGIGTTRLLGGSSNARRACSTNHLLATSNHATGPKRHGFNFQQLRRYTPMTKEEEEKEKARVDALTSFQKDQELRKLNREIARLEKFRGINTGELYTWSGRYKALARDYGMPLVAWYWMVWITTAGCCYGAITLFDIDTMQLIAQIDSRTGWDLYSKVDPEMGKIGFSIVLNEALEPLRLPVVILTTKPVVDRIFPPKY